MTRQDPPALLADGRWIGAHGIGRFAREVLGRLPAATRLQTALPLLHPLEPWFLHRAVGRLRPRLYFTPGFNPPWRSPVPVVMTLYDLIHLRVREESSPTKRAYYRFVVGAAARRGAHILTLSRFSRDEILAWSGLPAGQVTVVGAGVDSSFSPQGERYQAATPYFLHVGNHKPHKNVALLVQAFAAGPHKDLRLLLTGGMEPWLATLVRRLGLQDRVDCLGLVPDVDLPALYRGAVALLLPSLYEGFGLTALEAMACGTPVLAAKTTALPEVVGEAALLLPAREVDAWSAAMTQVRDDFELRRRLAAAGPRRARDFSWDEVGTRVRAVLARAARAEP